MPSAATMFASFALVPLLAGGCAHRRASSAEPTAHGTTPSVAHGSRLIRLRAQPGRLTRAQVKLTIEQELGGRQRGPGDARHVTLNFRGIDEETVEEVGPDGTAQTDARLVDVVGEGGAGADPQAVDSFAQALDELKIRFRRTARGAATDLSLSGVRAPLDEQTARAVVQIMYAVRGPLLPQAPVSVGSRWIERGPTGLGLGLSGSATYRMVFVREQDGVAVFDCEGMIEAQGASGSLRHSLQGRSTSEYRLDVDRGRLLGLVAESSTRIGQAAANEQAVENDVRQRVRVEWTLEGRE